MKDDDVRLPEQPSRSRQLPALGTEEAALYDILRTGGFEGQSVLYVAGDRGHLALHALEQGAGQTTILAANRHLIADAARASEATGLSPELIHGHWDRGGLKSRAFDNIVCSLPDCLAGDPLPWIRSMMASARKRLVLAVDSPRMADAGYLLAPLLARLPLMWLPKPPKPGRRLRRGFLMTPSAICHVFRYHTSAFEPVRILRSPVSGRLIVDARRRVIRNLVVIAGPSSSGKSTFVKRLVSDEAFRNSFGLTGNWRHVRGRDVVNLPSGIIDNLIVELDLMAVETGDTADFGDIPQFHILHCAARKTIFTVLPDPPPGHMPMSPAEASRAVRKCGRLGEALVAFYGRQSGGRLIHELYRSWIDWVRLLNPADMKLIINDYTEFREAPPDVLDALLAETEVKI